MTAALGAPLDPDTAAELSQLRVLARRQAQKLEILKKAIAIFCPKLSSLIGPPHFTLSLL